VEETNNHLFFICFWQSKFEGNILIVLVGVQWVEGVRDGGEILYFNSMWNFV